MIVEIQQEVILTSSILVIGGSAVTRRLAACGVDIRLMGFLRLGARAARNFIGAYQSSLATGGRGIILGGGGIETAGKLVLTSKKFLPV